MTVKIVNKIPPFDEQNFTADRLSIALDMLGLRYGYGKALKLMKQMPGVVHFKRRSGKHYYLIHLTDLWKYLSQHLPYASRLHIKDITTAQDFWERFLMYEEECHEDR